MRYLLWCATTVGLLILTHRVLRETETNTRETQLAYTLRFKLETSLIIIIIKHEECKHITTPKP
jgi:hypothetical protein